ncbi:MAG: endolytic transglycosylase MltG [Oscillospiraceae bacterium]|nr:endolytic transglycosylase MltG [Oscillospiraceae bacterium]
MANEKNKYETAYYNAEEVRRQSAGKKKKKKRSGQAVVLYLLCVLVVSCLLAGIGWLLVNDMCSLNKDYVEVAVTIEEEDSMGDISAKLKDAELINHRWFFRLVGGLFFDAKDTIDPGEWTVNSQMDYRALIRNMHDYEADLVEEEGWISVTIPEGMMVHEILQLLADKGVATYEELEDACANYEFQDYEFLNDELLGDIRRMEGYLFPSTYAFDPDRSAVYAIDTMLTTFVLQFDNELMADIRGSAYTWEEIVTMASIIEKEGIGNETERKNIASVLYNRMNTTDRETYGYLQLDTTIYYSLYIEGKDKTDFDIEKDTPYNTYKYPGLPEGPICCPGMSSIRAAVYPNDTDYFYFAAGKDGVNHFFESYNDHINFVNSDMYQPD